MKKTGVLHTGFFDSEPKATVNSLSGGRTSSYLGVHYPADYDLFALVCIEDHNAGGRIDRKLKQMANDKLQKYCPHMPEFVATSEDPIILKTMFQLEQKIGREIIWLRGISWEEMIFKVKKALPNRHWRFCTDILKIYPIFCFLFTHGLLPCIMRVGYRYDEKERAQRLRKVGYQVTKAGKGAPNQNRMGPLTFEARKEGLRWLKAIIHEVNTEARRLDRPEIDILNQEEENRILWHWKNLSWPQGWDGTEPVANESFIQYYSNGTFQPQLPFTGESVWTQIRDGNLYALDIFSRHYSFRTWRQRSGKNGTRFTGPGQQIILLSQNGNAIFAWVKQQYRNDDQQGVCCSIFRNESDILSSQLILEAESFAWEKWPGERLFTFVDSRKIRSSNPGFCFQQAGWKKSGKTKSRKLTILEKMP